MTIRSALLGVTVATTAFALDVAVVRRIVGPVPISDSWSDIMLLPVLVAAVIVAFAAGPVRAATATGWLDTRGLPTTDQLVHETQTWLRRTRTARGIGFSVLLVSGTAPAWLVNVSGLPPGAAMRDHLLELVAGWPLGGWAAPVAGYAIGAIVAELARRNKDLDGRARVADLRPRPLAGYLQPLSLWGPRVLTAVALLTTATAAATGTTPVQGISGTRLAGLCLLGLAVNEAVLRGVLRRRQSAPDALAIAFDDAARATTVHAVAGSTIGVLGTLLGDQLHAIGLALGGAVGTIVSLAALAIGVVALGVWLGHGVGLAHRVSRRDRVEVDA